MAYLSPNSQTNMESWDKINGELLRIITMDQNKFGSTLSVARLSGGANVQQQAGMTISYRARGSLTSEMAVIGTTSISGYIGYASKMDEEYEKVRSALMKPELERLMGMKEKPF